MEKRNNKPQSNKVEIDHVKEVVVNVHWILPEKNKKLPEEDLKQSPTLQEERMLIKIKHEMLDILMELRSEVLIKNMLYPIKFHEKLNKVSRLTDKLISYFPKEKDK